MVERIPWYIRSAGCLLCLLPFAGALAQEHPGRLESSIQIVQITASVVDDHGKAIDDLGSDDFVVTDGGVVQPVAFFQPPVAMQGSEAPSRSRVEPTLLGTNHLVIVLQPIRLEHRHRAIRAIQKFVRESKTAESYAIALVDGPNLVQTFTRDKERTLRALEEMRAWPKAPARIDERAERGAATRTSLGDLTRLPGRKAMIVFADPEVSGLGLTSEAAIRADVAVYPVDARGLVSVVPFGEASTEPRFAHGGTSLGTSWAGPAMAAQLMGRTSALGQQTGPLRSVAEATGGSRLVNDNDLGKVFRLMEENSRGVYVLGYPLPAADGQFHRVSVSVKRPGLTVRVKAGYFAPGS